MAQSCSHLCLWPQDKKGLKKKREIPKELRRDPPVLRVLGSGPVFLEPLLAGEPAVTTVCNFGVVRTPDSDKLTYARVLKDPWSCLFVSASLFLLYGWLAGPGRDRVRSWVVTGARGGALVVCQGCSTPLMAQVNHLPQQEHPVPG